MTNFTIDHRALSAIGALSAVVAPLKAVAQTSVSTPNEPGPYDLVITGGWIMGPETMYDDIANVAVKGGRIATITKNGITGKQTIDAKGLVVAPGFIDTHLHFQICAYCTLVQYRSGSLYDFMQLSLRP